MGDHHHGPAKGISRWLFTTNHKDIGTMYLWFSFAMFILGGAFAMIIRAELFQPGMQLVEPGFFNQMTTLHGLVMVFGAIMPSFVGLANWMIPMMIGAPDMALPRMNNWSFWILPPGFLMLASTLFMEGGAPAFGWTFYAPLSTTYAAPSVTFFIFAIHILGVSSIMGSINIIATVMNMRAPGMTYMKMPLFVWTWLITAFLLVAVMPVLAGAVTMMLMDIHFGTSFFSAAGGGDPCCSSTSSGSSVTPRCTSSSCRPSVWCLRSSLRSHASRCSATRQWFTPLQRLPSCRSSCGHTTCIPSACRSLVSCSSCTPLC
jgi:cytochrome c oxidase subunit 1